MITKVEFVAPAKELEDEMDATFGASAPQGRFSKGAMNELVKVYRQIETLMGLPGDYDLFDQDITAFPADFTRGLAMIAKALEDYRGEGLDLSALKNDRDIALLIADLKEVAEDDGFAAFLEESEANSMESEASQEVEDMDAMFASRVR